MMEVNFGVWLGSRCGSALLIGRWWHVAGAGPAVALVLFGARNFACNLPKAVAAGSIAVVPESLENDSLVRSVGDTRSRAVDSESLVLVLVVGSLVDELVVRGVPGGRWCCGSRRRLRGPRGLCD